MIIGLSLLCALSWGILALVLLVPRKPSIPSPSLVELLEKERSESRRLRYYLIMIDMVQKHLLYPDVYSQYDIRSKAVTWAPEISWTVDAIQALIDKFSAPDTLAHLEEYFYAWPEFDQYSRRTN